MKEKRSPRIKTILTAAILLIAAALMLLGSVKAELDGEAYRISAGIVGSETIPLRDITAVELRESFDPGVRSLGVGGLKISGGTFSNAEFGSYKLYKYNAVAAVVVVSLGESHVVFNLATYEETVSACEALKAAAEA